MKIRTERGPLADALTWASRVISKQPHNPSLAGIRLSAAEGVLTMKAYDYDSGHTAAVVADVGSDGECLVPGMFLRDVVAGARGAEVELILDNDALTVTSGRSAYRLRTLLLEDYPALPDFPETAGVVNPDAFSDALGRVLAAADDGHAAEQLRGLRLEGAEGELFLVATDRPHLHAFPISWDCEKPFAATVPSKAVTAAVKGMTDAITIGHTDGSLGFSDGTRQVTSRCYANEYAPWRKVIAGVESMVKHHVTVERADLLAVVKQVASVTESERPIVLHFEGSEVSVSTPDQEAGDGCEVVDAIGEGPEFTIGLNPRYFADALAASSSTQVDLRYAPGTASRPLLVRDPHHPDLTLIVMSKTLTKGQG